MVACGSVEVTPCTFDTDRNPKQGAFMNTVVNCCVRISSRAPVGDGWDAESLLEHYFGYAVGGFVAGECFFRIGCHDN